MTTTTAATAAARVTTTTISITISTAMAAREGLWWRRARVTPVMVPGVSLSSSAYARSSALCFSSNFLGASTLR